MPVCWSVKQMAVSHSYHVFMLAVHLDHIPLCLYWVGLIKYSRIAPPQNPSSVFLDL